VEQQIIKVLSLGAGVQSSTIYMMSCVGDLPRLDHAIFADTGNEPASVYSYLDWLLSQSEKYGIPIHVVKKPGGSLGDSILNRMKTGKHSSSIPAFFMGRDGERIPTNRSCTGDYKIKPIEAKLKELLGLGPRAWWPDVLCVETWLGISVDEWIRMRCSERNCIRYWHPLIEQPWKPGDKKPDLLESPLSRSHCLNWMSNRGYPRPPKSACIFCPYHSDYEWRNIMDNSPDEWNYSVHLDHTIRNGFAGMTQPVYLHQDLVPLDEADLNKNRDSTMDMECRGICGV
jgi:hypothetical protein